MMIYKEFSPNSFQFLSSIGMRVSPISESVKKWRLGLQIGLLNLVTVAFGVYAVKYVSIPIFLTFRRCSLLTTFAVNYYMNKTGADSRTALKLGLVTLGACIAGYDTFNRDWFGYFLIWMNNITNSFCNVYFNKINKDKKVTAMEINFFYAWVGLPIFLIYSIYSGEIYQISDVLDIGDLNHRFNFLMFLLMSGSMGFVITMSTLLVVTICTPFMINITGNMKNGLSILLGFFIFDDTDISPTVIGGITIGFTGSLIFAYDEIFGKRKEKKQ